MVNKHKSRILNRLRITAIAALYVGCSSWIGLRADDAQIYVPQVPSAQTPNVLFTIDTSGSMDNNVPDGTQSRIEAVKDALTSLMENTAVLKAGLGRFHYELGGPIIFPVIDLDSSPTFLDDTETISSIDRSSDDAEEISGVVTLDSTALEMTEVSVGGSTAILVETSSPATSSDDDEDGTAGNLTLTSPDLDIGQDDAGIRFPGIDIPQNAIILHAEIEFTSSNPHSDDANVVIIGEDVDNSLAFTEGGGGPTTVSSRLSNDPTSAQVPWSNIAALAAGDTVTTPNIRSIVQEIVNRGGWATGNAMAILFESVGGHREVATFDNGTYAAPILRIQYLEDGTVLEREVDTSRRDAGEESDGTLITNFNGFYLMEDNTLGVDHSLSGAIFSDIDIPAGAVVVWADIRWVARAERESAPADMEIYGILNPDLTQFTNGNKISVQTLSTAKVDWPAAVTTGNEEIFTPDDDDPIWTPNLASIVNEIRALPAFQPGDYVGFVFKDNTSLSGVNERQLCSYDGVENASGCPEPTTAGAKPTLRLVYAFPSGGTAAYQEVGLRFNNVRVPQGATIDSAYLEFTVDAQTTNPGTLTIAIENNTEPSSYSNTAGEKVSDRTYGTSTTWVTDDWDTIGELKQSPDISSLVSSVTNLGDWCGGGSLAFRITSSDTRSIAEAFDKGGSGAPKLRIDYDTSGLASGQGCTTKQTTVSIDDADNDVEETESDGSINFNSNDLDIESGVLVGLRFEGVDVPNGANVTSANLYLTGDGSDSGDTTISIFAQQHPNAPSFTNTNFDVSSRINQSGDPGPIQWVETTSWVEDGTYSPQDDGFDIAPLIQDIIDGTVTVGTEEWAAGNSLVFALDGSNLNNRRAEVCCGSDQPSRLEIFYEVNLGDIGAGGPVTGREAMLAIIDDLVASGWTPTVDAFFEGAAYYEGDPVHFGRTRGAGKSYESSGITTDTDLDSDIVDHTDAELLAQAQLSRISHSATYTPAATINPSTCTTADPNNANCITEHIDNTAAPDYISPFAGSEECEKGYLVLLSDGIANRNSSRELIKSLTGDASCDLDIPTIDNNGDPILSGGNFVTRDPSSDELCGLELARYLQSHDFIDEGGNDTDVLNNVRTFTIGFDLDVTDSAENKAAVEFLKALAFVGSGGDLSDPTGVPEVSYGDGFFTASNASELEFVFGNIVTEIIDDTTSFVAPGSTINAFNRLFNLDDIYFSLFKPDDNVSWLGNLKKFKLCTDEPNCIFGEVLDKDAKPAVHNTNPNDEDFGNLKEEAYGFWGGTDDSAPVIEQGGAGEKIPPYESRNVYVNTSNLSVPAPTGTDPETRGTALTRVDRTIHLDSTPPASTSDFNVVKAALYAEGNCSSGTLAEQNDCLNELIDWILGRRFAGDLPRYGDDSDDDRWAFGDPMHSRPLVLTYGRDDLGNADPDDDVPLTKILVGTNDGGLRLINEGDGVEEWIFHPYSMLGFQSTLKENANGSHEYGVDDTPTARVKTTDGVINPVNGDFAHVYFGLRRGGRKVFAVNVTPDSEVGLDAPRQTITTSGGHEYTISIGEKGKVTPEILWRIDATGTGFSRLGQTWSTPRPARILGNSGPKTVLIFGGGYSNSEQDGVDGSGFDKYNTSSDSDVQGNAIFIVDADDGSLLWWASNDLGADKVVSDMNTSIAAPVTLVDSNGDGLTDRLYAVDLRGQVFRADIQADPGAGIGDSEFGNSTVGVLAKLGSDTPTSDRRKFFYAPEVAQVNDTAIVEAAYDMIGIVSGNRTEPNGKVAQDRAYGIRDFLIDGTIASDASNYPACNPNPATSTCVVGTPLTHTELTDVTNENNFVIRDIDENGNISLLDADGGSSPSALTDLKESLGWYFNLEGEEFAEATPAITGEKGFSSATVLGGNMFFTTFLPPDTSGETEQTACSVLEVLGTSRFYAVDFFTGAPAFDRNADDAFDEVERFKSLGAGPSADVIPTFHDQGVTTIVSTGGGSIPEDPGPIDTVNKTFWLEEK